MVSGTHVGRHVPEWPLPAGLLVTLALESPHGPFTSVLWSLIHSTQLRRRIVSHPPSEGQLSEQHLTDRHVEAVMDALNELSIWYVCADADTLPT